MHFDDVDANQVPRFLLTCSVLGDKEALSLPMPTYSNIVSTVSDFDLPVRKWSTFGDACSGVD